MSIALVLLNLYNEKLLEILIKKQTVYSDYGCRTQHGIRIYNYNVLLRLAAIYNHAIYS